MTTTTSGRIDINGQGNSCGEELAIAGSMPAVLTGHMNDFAWTNFCDKIDETTVPINQAKKRLTICLPICMLLILVTFIIAIVSSDSRSNDRYDTNNDSGMSSFVPFIVVFFLTFASLPVTKCWASKIANEALEDMREVCEAESAKHPEISFHLRDMQQIQNHGSDVRVSTRQYIEVSVLNNAGLGKLAYGQGNVAEISTIPVVSAVPVALSTPPAFNPAAVAIPEPEFDIEAGTKKSPAERMRTLEDMKGLLSEEEYQRKRAEILSYV